MNRSETVHTFSSKFQCPLVLDYRMLSLMNLARNGFLTNVVDNVEHGIVHEEIDSVGNCC